jgi:pimeloyl-ACP methyl ester carboxylesterase
MVTGIRGAKVVRIPGAGHSSSLEEPEAVIAAMRELLQTGRKPSTTSAPL